jgi:hypothetical protein
MDLTVFLEPKLDLTRLATVLDEMGHEGRVHTVRGWGKKTQAMLFEAVKGLRPLTLAHFVPEDTAVLTEVIHEGKNTLPAFSHFQKRFARTESGDIVGYNHGITGSLTGPGYFTVHGAEAEGEIDIDYKMLPKERVATWPEILPNSARLGSLVYEGMVDHMRGISNHVSIGRAEKGGKMMDAWFVLCREPAGYRAAS